MEHVEYIHTSGMDESEIERRLDEGGYGVLALADDSDAYGVPLAFHYDGERILFRLGVEGDARKMSFIESTNRATFVQYEAESAESSWSIVIEGTLESTPDGFDDATINELFPPIRLFDEGVGETDIEIVALSMARVTGRRSLS